eukprot:CAMPEP_0118940072 /NCGR_PEP_ID=MMETSP1169-20130426/30546_1 /TAXON_ID=36882 /ORGANISM="Pyramimonas obovata, Strain CCMP722" /LENGTH=41 /DNA_ID= /DNA_START= /DNA_END= /DNA_ORIENTATION=
MYIAVRGNDGSIPARVTPAGDPAVLASPQARSGGPHAASCA